MHFLKTIVKLKHEINVRNFLRDKVWQRFTKFSDPKEGFSPSLRTTELNY